MDANLVGCVVDKGTVIYDFEKCYSDYVSCTLYLTATLYLYIKESASVLILFLQTCYYYLF